MEEIENEDNKEFEPQYPAQLYTTRPNATAIEMQAWKEDYEYEVRAEIQAARLLNNNAKKGNNWSSPKVYQISILNFHYGKDDNKILSWYTMKDETGQGLSDRLNIIFIDLKTIRKKLYTPIEELTPVEKWGLFFSYVDKEEYDDYISELVRSEKGIMAAERTVKYMSEADANWFTQNSRYIAELDRNTQIYNAEKRGLKKGAQQKAVEIARKLLTNGKYTADEISALLQIPVESFTDTVQA